MMPMMQVKLYQALFPLLLQAGLISRQISDHCPVITIISGRWEELHRLHTDPYRRRLSQDTGCVWAGCGRQGPLWHLSSQGKNAQRAGGHT